jgi:hypothetical protein
MITLTIDGLEIQARDGATVLEAADAAGIYIPRLCSHPALPAVDPGELEPWQEVYQGPVSTGVQSLLGPVSGASKKACASRPRMTISNRGVAES